VSRKRQAKKQSKRQHAWLDELEDLYLRGEDEAFLAAAHGDGRQAGSRDLAPVADAYREVVDRVLGRALAAGDLERLEELVPRIHRTARASPLVLLAEAAADLGRGRCAAARSRLAGPPLAAGVTTPEAPDLALLAQGLLALCDTAPGDAGRAEGEAEQDLGRFPQTLRREISGLRYLSRTPAPPPRPAGPRAAAVGDLLKALDGLRGRGCRPGPKALAVLRRAVEAVAELGLGDAAGRLLREIRERVELFAELGDVERALGQRARRGAELHRWLVERLSEPRLPTGLLQEEPSRLLAPLQHALRVRWRGLLELVAEHGGDAALTSLYAARQRLFAADLEVSAGAAGARALAARTAVEECLAAGRLDKLARLVAARGAEERDPARRAGLWSFELEIRHQEFDTLWEEAEDPEDEPDPHPILERVERMSAAIGDSFPAEQRPEVARFLRTELFDLTHILGFCGCFRAAAETLRRWLPDDPGLLVVAVAGAVADGDHKTRRRLEKEIAGRRKLPGDRELLPLLAEVATERPVKAATVLGTLRPLFADAFWQQAVAVVAKKVGDVLGAGLEESYAMASFDRGMAEQFLAGVERELDPFRPMLSGHADFEAVVLVLGCRDVPGRKASAAGTAKRIREFLERFPGVEAALALFGRIKLAVPGILPGSAEALASTISAVVERLDHRWRLWRREIPIVSLCADDRRRKALVKKIRKLLKDPALAEEDRRSIAAALDDVERAGRLRHFDLGALDFGDFDDLDRPASRKPKADAKKRRRRSKENPGQLALPGMT
jgi:hypothetical protein